MCANAIVHVQNIFPIVIGRPGPLSPSISSPLIYFNEILCTYLATFFVWKRRPGTGYGFGINFPRNRLHNGRFHLLTCIIFDLCGSSEV